MRVIRFTPSANAEFRGRKITAQVANEALAEAVRRQLEPGTEMPMLSETSVNVTAFASGGEGVGSSLRCPGPNSRLVHERRRWSWELGAVYPVLQRYFVHVDDRPAVLYRSYRLRLLPPARPEWRSLLLSWSVLSSY